MGIGFGCAITASTVRERTYIDLSKPATGAANMKKVCIGAPNFGDATVSAKVKIFRDDGTNYNFIAEEVITLSPGANDYNLTGLSVIAGDLIGIYTALSVASPNSTLCLNYLSSGAYQSGDITSNSLKTSWSAGLSPSIWCEFFEYYTKVSGNDALSGDSWANAWATINKAATTIPDGSTVHIGFGNYTAEPAGNKIAPQNVGASGISYLPETATTGGGTGTVSIEQNT